MFTVKRVCFELAIMVHDCNSTSKAVVRLEDSLLEDFEFKASLDLVRLYPK